MRSGSRSIIWIGLAVFFVVIIAFVLEFVTAWMGFGQSRVFRSIGLIAVALITFYGFLLRGLRRDALLDEKDIRTAITVSVLAVYLVLVGIVAFYSGSDKARELDPLTSTMITSFTAIVGIVVPFYFGTSAYVQVKSEEFERKGTPTSAEEKAKTASESE
jgi:uncharacterized membrane protein (DUF485 family)